MPPVDVAEVTRDGVGRGDEGGGMDVELEETLRGGGLELESKPADVDEFEGLIGALVRAGVAEETLEPEGVGGSCFAGVDCA
jgi:hypothetical protein